MPAVPGFLAHLDRRAVPDGVAGSPPLTFVAALLTCLVALVTNIASSLFRRLKLALPFKPIQPILRIGVAGFILAHG